MSFSFGRFAFRIKSIPGDVALIIEGAVKTLLQKQQLLTELNDQLAEIQKKTKETDQEILYATIGQTLTAWARMEEALVGIVALLLRLHTSKAGLIMYSIINFNVWLTLIHDLYGMDPVLQVHRKRWNKISERIREIKDKRDQLAHHPVRESELRVPRYDTRQKTKRQHPLNSREVISLSERIISITDDTIALIEDMARTLVTSGEKFDQLDHDHSIQSDSQ